MAEEKKDNAVLLSLKELKSVNVSDEKPKTSHAAIRKSGVARKFREEPLTTPPENEPSWGSSDDAEGLLAGILGETSQDAEAEVKAISEEQRRLEQIELQSKYDQDVQKQREIEQRLLLEEQRRKEAEKKREQTKYDLDIAERRARGEYIPEPEPELPKEEAKIDPATFQQNGAIPFPAQGSDSIPMVQPEPKSQVGKFMGIAAGFLLLIVSAIFVAYLFFGPQPQDSRLFQKQPISTVNYFQLPTEVGVVALYKEPVVPVTIEDPKDPKVSKKGTRKTRKPRKTKKKTKKTRFEIKTDFVY